MWKKCRVLGQKHRTSLRQTSVLLGQNIRTLWQRSPMFSFFRPENAVKSRNIPHFPILRYLDPKAGRGGFRGPSQPINDGGRAAGSSCKTTSEKYCTLVTLLWNQVVFLGGDSGGRVVQCLRRFIPGKYAPSGPHNNQTPEIRGGRERVSGV